ncbi:uncharacterized protein K452DRAFT_265156 [Aplosporella prunicola CBS 121167]|uniref:HTH myb-type domain-containing protein n=1 Tax=Aplosporella prunicola CBS 121167 TaxID=1176127 RepID=A0A6A6BR79_9PEZI|nr:uncharacterized protein K452DRAFT_265156 [Aplosporella prunicola CBS 121167]KAF2145805.1 hypothetical protein K452DRAFT_265156 [Aplosporella prunicola CBS 121167]
MVRTRNNTNDSSTAPDFQAAASSTDSPHSQKRAIPAPAPAGTLSRKRVKSDGHVSPLDTRHGLAQAALASGLSHAPSDPSMRTPGAAMQLNQAQPADTHNGFSVDYAPANPADASGYSAAFGASWPQIPKGYYDSTTTYGAPIPQPPFPQSQATFDPPIASQLQSAIYNEQYPVMSENSMAATNLPILGNLASQILTTLGQPTFQDTYTAVNKVDTPTGQEYATKKGLFEQTFKQFVRGQPFIDAKALHLDSQPYLDVVRKSNLAAFVLIIFGGQEVSLNTLNEHFLDIFAPGGARLLKWQGGLWLELKTQAYIQSVMKGEARQKVVDSLFPTNMEDVLLSRLSPSEPRRLSPTEQQIASLSLQRRQYLLGEPDTIEGKIALSRKYDWIEFLKEVNRCIGKNMDGSSAATESRHNSQSSPYGGNNYTHTASPDGFYPQMHEPSGGNYDETITRAALMAHAAINGQANNSSDIQQNPTPFFQAYPQVAQQHQPSYPASKTVTPPSPVPVQSAPTQVLYDRARQASTVRAPPNSRKPGAANQRRPWSLDEERALMDGLDRVKGPHWSQILALYGAGGTISEILKERNQVQLKDKARNLKLFFLKSGVEVPVYLQGVTGDLKTRAPAQAAKQEALAKQRREEQENMQRDQRAQMDAAAVLAAGPRWPSSAGIAMGTSVAEPFGHALAMGFPPTATGQPPGAIDPTLDHRGEGAGMG